MKIIEKYDNQHFPLKWANLNNYTESKGEKREIYLVEHRNLLEDMISLFYFLFGMSKDDILVYNESWWNFCLDTWDINKDNYNYDLNNKSDETKEYLKMLNDSGIEIGFSGICKCIDWDIFLHIVLKCIINHIAPYSPVFYNKKKNFFFYFHHSGSIGIYYKNNKTINLIIRNAMDKFDVKG